MLKAINGKYDDSLNFAGVRQYAQAGGASAVVIWGLRWKLYEPAPGQYNEQLWADLDQQMFKAYVDKRTIILALSTETPPWAIARQTHGRTVPRASGWRLPPDDTSTVGPWAKYLERHLLRYPNIGGIVIVNEPNAEFMDAVMPGRVTATMIKTATRLWARHRSKPILLAPATLDGPGALRFSWEVLSGLKRGWKPPTGVIVAWAHHPYTDVKKGVTGIRSQTWQLLQLLRAWKWCGGAKVWLTESGYVFDTAGGPPPYPQNYHYSLPEADQERVQLANVTSFYRWAKQTGKVALLATYEYRASLWGGWDSALLRHADGSARPLHEAWRAL